MPTYMGRDNTLFYYITPKKVLHSYECNTFLIGMQHFLGECDTFFERKTLYLHHERNI